MSEPKKSEGWFSPINTKKHHYFRESKSLCGKWMCFNSSDLVTDNPEEDTGNDCATCKRKLRGKIKK